MCLAKHSLRSYFVLVNILVSHFRFRGSLGDTDNGTEGIQSLCLNSASIPTCVFSRHDWSKDSTTLIWAHGGSPALFPFLALSGEVVVGS